MTATVQSRLTEAEAARLAAELESAHTEPAIVAVACGHPECEADRWPLEDGGAACHRRYAGE